MVSRAWSSGSWQLGLSMGLTLLVGYLLYRGVPDWGQAWRVMIDAHPGILLAGVGFIFVHMLLRAMRWRVLLSPVKPAIPLKQLLSLTILKYVVNLIPPRAGEVAGSILLARKERISIASVIATSVLERILDMATVLFLFGSYMAFFSHRFLPGTERGREIMLSVQDYSLKAFIVLCAGILFLLLLIRNPRWLDRLPTFLGRILTPFLKGFGSIHDGRMLIRAGGLSLAIWLAITMQLWLMVRAYLLDFPLPATLMLVSLTVVGVALPTPGGVGGFQFFMSLGLVNFFAQYMAAGDPRSQAAGVSNGCFIASMVPLIAVGLLILHREGVSLFRVSRMGQQLEEEPAAADGVEGTHPVGGGPA